MSAQTVTELRIQDKLMMSHDLLGTCSAIAGTIADRYNITVEEMNDIVIDFNVEVCPGCGWYVETCELADDDNNPCECENCRDYNG